MSGKICENPDCNNVVTTKRNGIYNTYCSRDCYKKSKSFGRFVNPGRNATKPNMFVGEEDVAAARELGFEL